VRLDQLSKFTPEDLQIDELLRARVGEDVGKLKAALNLWSLNGFIQSSANLTIHLPQFDAMCRRVLNFFLHKKLDLAQCLSKKS